MQNTLLTKPAVILAAFIATVFLAGCGDDTTGPAEGEDGWQTYTLEGYTFEWLVEDSLSSLRVKITAPTTGWVAVGFDPTSFMSEANLIIGYVDGDTTDIRDDYGTGAVTHDADTNLGGTNDVETILGMESEANELTMLEFRIPLNSGDQYDKVLEKGNTYLIIFAYGYSHADDYTTQHAWAGSTSIEL